jgi:hypothetical protein
MIVPYNASLLLLYEGHCNVQFCTSGGLAAYISKYVTKSEPKSLVKVNGGNHVTSHLLARRRSSMENMVLLLSFPIFNMTSGSLYLPTSMPSMRASTVKAAHLLALDPEDPYYADALEKYFARPAGDVFDGLTYFDYFRNHSVCRSYMSGRRGGVKDDKGYWVFPRQKASS